MYTVTDIGRFCPSSYLNNPTIDANHEAVLNRIPSSYSKNNYCAVFQYLIQRYRPDRVAEFGVLGGYSTISMAIALSKLERGKIKGYDLFEDYRFNSHSLAGTKKNVVDAGLDRWVELVQCDIAKDLDYERIVCEADFLHVDLSNDGDTVETFIDLPGPKVIVFEGGSEQRDDVDWMRKFSKRKMAPVFKGYGNKYNITTVHDYPSITVVERTH